MHGFTVIRICVSACPFEEYCQNKSKASKNSKKKKKQTTILHLSLKTGYSTLKQESVVEMCEREPQTDLSLSSQVVQFCLSEPRFHICRTEIIIHYTLLRIAF